MADCLVIASTLPFCLVIEAATGPNSTAFINENNLHHLSTLLTLLYVRRVMDIKHCNWRPRHDCHRWISCSTLRRHRRVDWRAEQCGGRSPVERELLGVGLSRHRVYRHSVPLRDRDLRAGDARYERVAGRCTAHRGPRTR